MSVQINCEIKKIQHSQNYFGPIRSNLNFEIVLKVKKANTKSHKIAKLFLAILSKDTGKG